MTLLAYRVRRAICNLALCTIVLTGAAAAEPITIVALGDSLTAGYGLPKDQGLVPQLQSWLAAQGSDAQVVNAGVSGDTTAGGLARLGWSLTPEVDALIVELGANDMLRGIDPSVPRGNLDAILQQATEQGLPVLLIGVPALRNYGPDYRTAFDAIYPDLSAQYGTLLMPDFFGPLRSAADPTASLARFIQSDGLHPNAEGVAQVVTALGPLVLDLAARVPTQ
jgi:acyl-CoA thioesterase I